MVSKFVSFLLLGLSWNAGLAAFAAAPQSPPQPPNIAKYSEMLQIRKWNISVLKGESFSGEVAADGTLVVTLNQHKGNDYPNLVVVPQPQNAPPEGIEYVLTYEARFRPTSKGDVGVLGLGLCDDRGWGPVHSAIAVTGAERAGEWKRLTGVYRPLADGKGVIILARIESGSNTVSGTLEIRHIRLEAQSLPAATVTAAEMAELETIVIPEQQRRNAPPVERGFTSAIVGSGAFNPGIEFYTEAKDKWGASVIRLWLDPISAAKQKHMDIWENWPSFLDQIEAAVKKAQQVGIKVVLTTSAFPLARNVNRTQAEFWAQSDLDAVACRFWKDIAQRLRPYHEAIYGYDLFNEPMDLSQATVPPPKWRSLAIKIVQTIRSVDPDVWVIYEPGPWAVPSGFENLPPLPDKKIIYSFHFYEPHEFTHQGVYDIKNTDLIHAMEKVNVPYPGVIAGVKWDKAQLAACLAPVDKFQARWGVPIYVGEFSAIRWAPNEDAAQWLRDVTDLFNQRKWSWSYHSYKEWFGWSLEYDSKFWMEGMPYPTPTKEETQRAKVIKAALGTR